MHLSDFVIPSGIIQLTADCLTFIGNIQADPRFVGTYNYRRQPGSPAIDAADYPYTQPNDYGFTPRPQGNASDIGAFEFYAQP